MRRLGWSMAVAVVALGVLAPPLAAEARASVQSEDPSADAGQVMRVESVDARGDTWTATVVSSEGEPTVSVDGKALAATVEAPSTDVVLVLDNDRSLPNATLQLSAKAAASIVPGAGGIRNVAVVSTAREGAHQQLGLSSDPEAVSSAVDDVAVSGDSATWDALGRAADLLEGSDADSKRVVAYLSAADKLSLSSPGAAEAALRIADARLDVVALPAGVDTGALTEMVLSTGGSLDSVPTDEDFDTATATVTQRLSQQYRLEFAPPAGDEQSVQLEFSAGDTSRLVQVDRGSSAVGNDALEVPINTAGFLDRLTNHAQFGWVLIVLVALAVIALAWSVLSMVLPNADSLSRRLRVYDDAPEEEDEDSDEVPGVTTVPLLQRAVAITSGVADRRGFLESLEVSLERASLPLRAAEALFFLSAAAVLVGIATIAITRNLLVAVGAAVLTVLIPKGVLDFRVRSRQKAFVGQLPDMLALLAGTLKAGYSITQGFEAVSREVGDPMGMELRRVVTEHRLGRSLEDALDATADRMGSDDFAWTVMAIKIQREVGGNLAELLMTVANTMTQRERLRRDVNSLTAEGRISAMILGLLPTGARGRHVCDEPRVHHGAVHPRIGLRDGRRRGSGDGHRVHLDEEDHHHRGVADVAHHPPRQHSGRRNRVRRGLRGALPDRGAPDDP